MIPSFKHGIIASGRPRVVAGGGGSDVTPNGVTWGEATYEEDGFCPAGCWLNTGAQITGINTTINLYLYWDGFPTSTDRPWVKVANSYNAADQNETPSAGSGWTQLSSGDLFSVSNNQWVWFGTNTYDETIRTLMVRNSSDGGVVLDQYDQYFINACLLTTVVVNYFGLQDDGPELTAMRALRTHYAPVAAAELADYYENSPRIIDAIITAGTQTTEYDYIYNTVLAISTHVNAEEWQEAHDLYMAMYVDLKNRYLG